MKKVKDKMNICHLNTHDIAGGAAKVAWRLVEAQNKLGHNSKILSSIKKSDAPYSNSFPAEADQSLKKNFKEKGLLYYEYQGSHKLISNPVIKNSDVVHLHNIHGDYFNPFSLMLLARSKPTIWTLHDMQALTGHCAHSFDCEKWADGCSNCPSLSIYPELLTDSANRLWNDKKYIYENSEFVVTVPSNWLKKKVENSILKNRRCELIYNGIDTNVFSPGDKNSLRKKYNIPENAFILGGVATGGALDNFWKGGDYMLAALTEIFREVPDAFFINIGSLTTNNNPRIINIPPIPDESLLSEIYSLMDIYLTTSIADNAPLVVLEALACGVPVVSFATGGIPDMVKHGHSGIITEYKNSNQIVNEIVQLSRNRNTLKKFSENARADAVSRFDLDLINNQYIELYNESIGSFGSQRKYFDMSGVPAEIRTRQFEDAYKILEEKNTPIDVSIVLATKNRAGLLDEMLNSLATAARKISYEVIVIDGNSTDNTMEVLKKHNITNVYNEEIELGKGRHSWSELYNWGFSKASGKWAMYGSDDIIFEKDAFDNAVQLLNNSNGNIAGGAFFYKNVVAKGEWNDFGVDYTYGQNVLINYGLVRLDLFNSVKGLDKNYKFYCADSDLCLALINKGYKIIPLSSSKVVHNNILDKVKEQNLQVVESDISFLQNKWTRFFNTQIPNPRRVMLSDFEKSMNASQNINSEKQDIQETKLHLDCGQKYLPGYINIAYPQDQQNLMEVKADKYIDITKMSVHEDSVDEIRSHHLFEHFPRVEAIGMLIRWHSWLKIGGVLRIETPDYEGISETYLNSNDFKIKMAQLRHLAGDQAAHWAYHLEHWSAERFKIYLEHLGYQIIDIKRSKWNRWPYLANVEVYAKKITTTNLDLITAKGKELLKLSLVADSEINTFNEWAKQLDAFVYENKSLTFLDTLSAKLENMFNDLILPEVKQINLPVIHDLNQLTRDEWIKRKSKEIAAGSKILDVGAGTCPYKNLFNHCQYVSHDFKKYEGTKLHSQSDYGEINIVSDILNIPVDDNSFDVILCTEVLEHLPEPNFAIKELSRIVKPGGKIIITAPLGSGLHQLPYHYYGGYTPEWYKLMSEKNNLELSEIKSNGGFFRLLAQESARFSWTYSNHQQFHKEYGEVLKKLMGEFLPRYFVQLDSMNYNDQFTIGYHVVFTKLSDKKDVELNKRQSINRNNPAGSELKALKQYAQKAIEINPENEWISKMLNELENL